MCLPGPGPSYGWQWASLWALWRPSLQSNAACHAGPTRTLRRPGVGACHPRGHTRCAARSSLLLKWEHIVLRSSGCVHIAFVQARKHRMLTNSVRASCRLPATCATSENLPSLMRSALASMVRICLLMSSNCDLVCQPRKLTNMLHVRTRFKHFSIRLKQSLKGHIHAGNSAALPSSNRLDGSVHASLSVNHWAGPAGANLSTVAEDPAGTRGYTSLSRSIGGQHTTEGSAGASGHFAPMANSAPLAGTQQQGGHSGRLTTTAAPVVPAAAQSGRSGHTGGVAATGMQLANMPLLLQAPAFCAENALPHNNCPDCTEVQRCTSQ